MENELLIITNDFKDRMKSKNREIGELKKFIIACYGIVRMADENEDIGLLQMLRSIISEKCNELLNIDSDDMEERLI